MPVETMFYVSFDPRVNSPEEAAQALCIQQAADFQVEEENLVSNCVVPVTEFIGIKLKQQGITFHN